MAGTSLQAIKTFPGDLTPEDLAAHLGISHHVVDFALDRKPESIGVEVVLYHNGAPVSRSGSVADATNDARQRAHRFAVLWEREPQVLNDKVRVSIHGTFTTRFEVEIPSKANLSFAHVEPEFDAQGRLLLAYEVPINADGGRVLTDENSTAEGAEWALVLELDLEYSDR